MFCMECGAQLPEGSHFCIKCGTSLQKNNEKKTDVKLVKAQCTNCNGTLEVDASKEAAICPFCNTPYIVEKAINNYNIKMNTGNMNIANAVINVSSVSNDMNVDNLLLRAKEFEREGDFKEAVNYYNRVLDIDVGRFEAKDAIKRINKEIEEYVYYRIAANTLLTFGELLLRRGKLIFVNKKGKETVYYIDRINNPRKTMGCIGFMYDGKTSEVSYACQKASEVVEVILNAKKGIYPDMRLYNQTEDAITKDILEKFDSNSKIDAIKYYREHTGKGLNEAKKYIDSLL